MSFLPILRYDLRSSAKPSELITLLGNHVQSWPIITRLGGHKVFAGTVTDSGFRIVRVGSTRNSFRPTLFGVFSPAGQYTIIRVTIRHSAIFFVPLIIMFLLFFLYFSLQEVLPLLYAILRSDTQDVLRYISPPSLYFLLSPLAVLLLGYLFSWIFFSSEANAAKNELAEILSPGCEEPLVTSDVS